MLITRTSMISGKTCTLDLPITDQQLADCAAGGSLQDVFGHLPPAQREFIKSGITDEEWQAVMASPEPYDDWDDEPPD